MEKSIKHSQKSRVTEITIMKSQKFKFSENPNDKTGESSDSDEESGSSNGEIGNEVYLMTSSTMNEQEGAAY